MINQIYSCIQAELMASRLRTSNISNLAFSHPLPLECDLEVSQFEGGCILAVDAFWRVDAFLVAKSERTSKLKGQVWGFSDLVILPGKVQLRGRWDCDGILKSRRLVIPIKTQCRCVFRRPFM